MTKKEREYLENLEECFEQVKSAYTDAKAEISELTEHIEMLEKLCKQHSIKIPDFQESSFF